MLTEYTALSRQGERSVERHERLHHPARHMMAMPHSQEVDLRRVLVSSLSLLYFLEIASAVCPSGFFGLHCRYGCRCLGLFCDENGNCLPNTPCVNGYFGPQCQYINVVNVNSKADWVHDDNDTTCSPSASPQQVTVKLATVTLMSWVRIHVKNPQGIGEVTSAISVKLNGTVDCIKKRVYRFLPEVLDVTCDNIALISSIAIDGAITPHICNVLVSGGRNVAYRQNTTVIGIGKNFSTTKPVDENFYCRGALTEIAREIIITLFQPQVLFQIDLYLAKNFTKHNISLTTYLGQALAFSDTKIDVSQRVTNVFSLDFKPFDSLRVQITPNVEFCEVAAIGETWCELTHYGYDCQHPCQCQQNHICFSPTGMCGTECPSGSYGFMCSRKCGRGCLNHKCDYRRGNCSCIPGFKDDGICKTEYPHKTNVTNSPGNCSGRCKGTSDCDRVSGDCTECVDGYFGIGCNFLCPTDCLNQRCNKATAECYTCAKGRFGDNCTNVCPHQTNGKNCSRNCFRHCKGTSDCDRVSGDCTECVNGYFGVGCSFQCPTDCKKCNKVTAECYTCAKGRFGGNCAKKCPEDCLDSECNITTGNCSECEPPTCQPPESMITLWPALFATPLLPALCIAVMWFAKRKTNVVTVTEEDKPVTEIQEPVQEDAIVPQISLSQATESSTMESTYSVESEV